MLLKYENTTKIRISCANKISNQIPSIPGVFFTIPGDLEITPHSWRLPEIPGDLAGLHAHLEAPRAPPNRGECKTFFFDNFPFFFYPNGTCTHPPTSKLFWDFLNFFNFAKPLNAATNEVRKSKRNFEHKLAQNIKSDSNSFYAYVRSN